MNPFPGLRPFRPDEAQLFMGREVTLGSILTRVRISPLSLLFARSGVGKSSFLTCRLIPALAEGAAVRYRNEWGGRTPEDLIDQELDALLAQRNGFREKPLLVLDQFEDVFKLPNPREKLWDKLAELVNVPDSPAHVLISMREEWLGAWEEAVDFLPEATGSTVRLAPLNDRELTRAVLKPPEVEGTVSVEPELAQELLRDLKRPTAFGLGEGYVEPGLLQLVCHRLWEEASATREKKMTAALYENLGRADRISREFVWKELGHAGESSRFTTFDRVLWVGLTRHLVVAQGIKAITSPTALARKMRIEDLGFAGPAVVDAYLPGYDRSYLTEAPEKRVDPPQSLVGWISEVLDKGVQAGFLKQQRGMPSAVPGMREPPALKNLFELSHDSLGEIFQQFSVEFEGWIRSRWAKLLGIVFGGFIGLPILLIAIAAIGFFQALLGAVMGIGILVLYIGMIWIMTKIMEFLYELIAFPIIRRLAKGVVPLPFGRSRK